MGGREPWFQRMLIDGTTSAAEKYADDIIICLSPFGGLAVSTHDLPALAARCESSR